jgi:hypothetical protein
VRARVLALLIGAVLAAGALPGVAHANPAGKKAIWGPVSIDGKSEFPLYHRLGVGIFEMHLFWYQVAPTRPRHARDPADPAYRWPAEIGKSIREAARYHIQIMIQVSGTPRWANGGKAWNYPPTPVGRLAEFMTAAARRYRSVHQWMIWGEPDRQANFGLVRRVPASDRRLTSAQTRAPHVYAQMLDATYGALKAVSPRNLVIGGNTYTWGDIPVRQWVENLRLPNGRPPRMDLYGHNPFSYRAPDLANRPSPFGGYDFSDLARLSRLVNANLARHGHPIRLFLSEWTIPTASWDSEFSFYVDPLVAAQWIQDAWRIVHRSSFIYALGWIHVFDGPTGDGSSGGLLTNQGQPTPLYDAFKNG